MVENLSVSRGAARVTLPAPLFLERDRRGTVAWRRDATDRGVRRWAERRCTVASGGAGGFVCRRGWASSSSCCCAAAGSGRRLVVAQPFAGRRGFPGASPAVAAAGRPRGRRLRGELLRMPRHPRRGRLRADARGRRLREPRGADGRGGRHPDAGLWRPAERRPDPGRGGVRGRSHRRPRGAHGGEPPRAARPTASTVPAATAPPAAAARSPAAATRPISRSTPRPRRSPP